MSSASGLIGAAALTLAGCAADGAKEMPPTAIAGGEAGCIAQAVQGMIGETVNAETGTQLLARSGARILRWAPPNSALTMDYRPDRLTVHYDGSMRIERIACG